MIRPTPALWVLISDFRPFLLLPDRQLFSKLNVLF